jgi:hypothetical protein
MKSLSKGLLILLVLSSVVFAADLTSAKAQGWVGEQRDGLLGLVRADAPADVKALVAQVNSERKARFAEIAARTQVTPEQAAQVFAREAVERTVPGNYIQDASGRWARK